jgi:hypothetical protein
MRTGSLEYLQGCDGRCSLQVCGRVGRWQRTVELMQKGVGESEAVSGFDDASI